MSSSDMEPEWQEARGTKRKAGPAKSTTPPLPSGNNQVRIPEKVYIKSLNNEMKFTEEKTLKALKESHPRLRISTIRVLSKSTVVIVSHESGSANYLMKREHAAKLEKILGAITMEVHDPTYQNRIRENNTQLNHVIGKNVPQHVHMEEIQEAIKTNFEIGECTAHRIISARFGKPTNSVRIILTSNEDAKDVIREGIEIENLIIRCEAPYAKEEIRCYKCQQYGHQSRDCRHTLTCRHCGETHAMKTCPNTDKEPFCAICEGNHRASDKVCPAYQEYRGRQLAEKKNNEKQKADEEKSQNMIRTYSQATQEIKLVPKLLQQNMNEIADSIKQAIKEALAPMIQLMTTILNMVEKTNNLAIANTEAIAKASGDQAYILQSFTKDLKLMMNQYLSGSRREARSSSTQPAQPSTKTQPPK